MALSDYYKDHYFRESSRRHELTNALSLPSGVLTLLIGGLLVIAKEINLPLNCIAIVQLILVFLATTFIIATLYFLIRSYFNYEYGYIATAKEIKDYRDKLLAYYLPADGADAANKADMETLEYIDREYAKYADKNAKNNDRKSSFLHKANGALILSVVLAMLSALPYVVKSVVTRGEVHKVEVINLKEVRMADPKPAQQQSDPRPQTTQQQQPISAPEKPLPPPGRVIKEHVDPTKNK